jgi:enolase-phosphatase E1
VTTALLLDVEGTTTPVDFVYGVLFPFARARVRGFLAGHASEADVQADVAALRGAHAAETEGAPPWRADAEIDSAVAYVHWLMDRDRKPTPLKSLQGRIWEEGYRSGALIGQVYPDVPAALDKWRREGCAVAIFSSGSVLAQRLLFAHSSAGDLTPFIAAYFDTTTGPKREAESYRRIVSALGVPAAEMLFVSDIAAELDAARLAGLKTALCVRSGPLPEGSPHPPVRTLESL